MRQHGGGAGGGAECVGVLGGQGQGVYQVQGPRVLVLGGLLLAALGAPALRGGLGGVAGQLGPVGFRVWGFRCSVQGLGSGVWMCTRLGPAGLRVQDARSRLPGSGLHPAPAGTSRHELPKDQDSRPSVAYGPMAGGCSPGAC